MKIFVWENHVSNAYHDDGTLVVLANTLEEAQAIAIKEESECKDHQEKCDRSIKFPREADLIIELDKPCLVAFNGGGYD